jgi:hypothetical protein
MHKPISQTLPLATLTQIILILELLKKAIKCFFDELYFAGK